jgi:sulfur carrier protein
VADTVFFMKIRLNGDEREIGQGMSVGRLLEELEIRPGRVVIELNHDILSRDKHNATVLREGDVVEIVHFVGGG